jgi:hypothetical protein
VAGHDSVSKLGRDGLVRAAHLDARLFEQHQDGLARQLAPSELAGNVGGHIGGDVGQRPLFGAAHPDRLLHGVAHRDVQRAGHGTRCCDRVHIQHLDGGTQAHADQVLQQAGEMRAAALALTARAVGGGWGGWHRAGAPARLAGDHALAFQKLQRAAHRDTRHRELPHQRQFARQTIGKPTLLQLLAQHQIDLVVLGERQIVGRHGGHIRNSSNVLSIRHLGAKFVLLQTFAAPVHCTERTQPPCQQGEMCTAAMRNGAPFLRHVTRPH